MNIEEFKGLSEKEATEFFAEIYYGEHHIPGSIKEYGNGYCVNDDNCVATYDYDRLTRMVFLAHDKCYRLQIQPGAPGKIKIIIWKRHTRIGTMVERHPTIEEAYNIWRQEHPAPAQGEQDNKNKE